MKYGIYDMEMTALSPIYSEEIKNKEKDAKKKNHMIATRIDNGYAVVNIHEPMHELPPSSMHEMYPYMQMLVVESGNSRSL
jgi:hypothetical protein